MRPVAITAWPSLKRKFKLLLRLLFERAQAVGLEVLPRHYYSEIPDIAALRADRGWRQPFSFVGVRGVEPAEQLDVVERWCTPGTVERSDVYAQACVAAGEVGYGQIETQLLYCFIGVVRPRRVIQVGCGVATEVMLRASSDAGHDLHMTCIEPFPSEYLRRRAVNGDIELIEQGAEKVDLARFTELVSGDLLFIDSTHTVKPGSEVNRIVFEVLPRLAAGCHVHFHDIYWPHVYAPGLLTHDLFFWNEPALLYAYLINNAHFTPRVCMSMLHHYDPHGLRRVFPSYRPARDVDGLLMDDSVVNGAAHFPSAAYFEVEG
jgi:hypothetical protein